MARRIDLNRPTLKAAIVECRFQDRRVELEGSCYQHSCWLQEGGRHVSKTKQRCSDERSNQVSTGCIGRESLLKMAEKCRIHNAFVSKNENKNVVRRVTCQASRHPRFNLTSSLPHGLSLTSSKPNQKKKKNCQSLVEIIRIYIVTKLLCLSCPSLHFPVSL